MLIPFLAPFDYFSKATSFLKQGATVRKLGTDEQKTFEILEEVNRREKQNPNIKKQFSQAVLLDLDVKGLNQKDIHRLLDKGKGNVIPGIFRNEFSPTFSKADLAKAERLWQGSSALKVTTLDQVWAEVSDLFDLSNTVDNSLHVFFSSAEYVLGTSPAITFPPRSGTYDSLKTYLKK